MDYSSIKDLLHRSIGLHAESIGESSIDRAISQRMSEVSCVSADLYYDLLLSSKAELEELIEEVVVPETWFFRNVYPFDVLRDKAKEIYFREKIAWNKNNSNAGVEKFKMNILSIPCSSGEEAYSLSMVLRDAGLESGEYKIDAVDVSKRALRKARRGIYGKHSFREKNVHIQERFFEKVKSGFRIKPEVSDCVSFKNANILIDSVSPKAEYYDVIFCRNLLIYFDRETQKNVLNKLSAMLKNGGLLFVGHAEAGQMDKSVFHNLRAEKAFAFVKASAKERNPTITIGGDRPEAADGHVNKLKGIFDQLVEVTRKDLELSNRITKSYSGIRKSVKDKPPAKESQNIISRVNLLINKGRLSEAEKLCEVFVRENKESADGYYCLGLISNLQGSVSGAESFLKKAIYLSPTHHKALALSAVLAEKRGDQESAKSLRRREQKARKRGA